MLALYHNMINFSAVLIERLFENGTVQVLFEHQHDSR